MKQEEAFTLTDLIVVIAVVGVLVLLPITALAKTKAGSQRIHCVNNLKKIGLAFRQWADSHGDRYPMRVPYNDGGPYMGAAAIPPTFDNTPTMSASPNYQRVFRIFGVMSNELGTPAVLSCPAEGIAGKSTATTFSYSAPPGEVAYANNTVVSYFLGIDADPTQPQMFLAGDGNIGAGTVMDTPALALYPGFTALGPQLNISIPPTPLAAWTLQTHQTNGNVCLADGSVQQLTTPRLKEALKHTGDLGVANQYNRVAFPR